MCPHDVFWSLSHPTPVLIVTARLIDLIWSLFHIHSLCSVLSLFKSILIFVSLLSLSLVYMLLCVIYCIYIYSQLIVDKSAKTTHYWKNSLFSNAHVSNGNLHTNEWIYTPTSHHIKKINSKLSKHLVVNSYNPCDLGLGNGFLDVTPKASGKKINWDCKKLFLNCASKNIPRKWKDNLQNVKNVCKPRIW